MGKGADSGGGGVSLALPGGCVDDGWLSAAGTLSSSWQRPEPAVVKQCMQDALAGSSAQAVWRRSGAAGGRRGSLKAAKGAELELDRMVRRLPPPQPDSGCLASQLPTQSPCDYHS